MLSSLPDFRCSGHRTAMHPIIQQHLTAIEALCVQFGARRLEVFGSLARDDFDPLTSDVDFFVEFHDLGWQGSFKRYMGLKLGLEDLLGRPVDLVELNAIENPHFLRIANQHRSLVYAAHICN